jgi:hypothetical protein
MTDSPPTPDGNHDINIDSNMDMIIPGLYLGKLGPASLLLVLSSTLVEHFIYAVHSLSGTNLGCAPLELRMFCLSRHIVTL